MIDLKWTAQTKNISELKEWSKNPRKIIGEEYEKLKSDIQKYGFHDVLKIDLDGTIISGHQRKRALMELGIDKIQVVMPNRKLTEKEREVIAVASNLHRGFFDDDILANEFDIENLFDAGMSKKDLNFFDLSEDEFNEDDELANITEPKAKLGDVFILNNHRLMVGDATKQEDVEKLMSGSKARLLFCDPPYGVSYKSPSGSKYKSKHKDILNDNLRDEELQEFLRLAFQNAFAFTTDDASFYSWYATSTHNEFRSAMELSGWRYSQIIIWIKSRFVLSRSDYHHGFEPCMYGWKNGNKHFSNSNLRSFSDIQSLDFEQFSQHLDVWFVQKDSNKYYEHPTQKPVRLAERALKMNTEHGDIVMDLFNGSGSTLMACEQSGRHYRGMELDPKYIDVTLTRWCKFTGKNNIIRNGQPYEWNTN